jgi:hypothetical protein
MKTFQLACARSSTHFDKGAVDKSSSKAKAMLPFHVNDVVRPFSLIAENKKA